MGEGLNTCFCVPNNIPRTIKEIYCWAIRARDRRDRKRGRNLGRKV